MRIQSIAVIGATELGCQFAALSLRAGCRAILEDVSISALERAAVAIQTLRTRESSGSAGGRPATVNAAAPLLVTAHSVEEAIRDADLIIEAVSDELEMKLELFTIFDKFAKPGAIFATTTTSFSIDDLAEMTMCAERCVGLRLNFAGDAGQSLRIVGGTATSDETVAACRELAHRMALAHAPEPGS